LRSDRFVTESVEIRSPGTLTVQLDVTAEGLRLHLEGKVEFARLVPQLVVTTNPVLEKLGGSLPSGAMVPVEATLIGKVTTSVAERNDLLEVIERDKLLLKWTISDGTNQILEEKSKIPDGTPWTSTLRFDHPGEQVLAVELRDGAGTCLDSVRWKLQVGPPPIEFTVVAVSPCRCVAQRAGAWSSWFHEWIFMRWYASSCRDRRGAGRTSRRGQSCKKSPSGCG
jgi:hypothetical protein